MGERVTSRPGFWAAHHEGELTALVVLLVVVLVTAVLGGFRDASDEVASVPPGQAVELGSLTVRVERARAGDGGVVLEVTLTNTGRESRSLAGVRSLAVGGRPLGVRAVEPTVAFLDPDAVVPVLATVPAQGGDEGDTVEVDLRRDSPPDDPLDPTRGGAVDTVARVRVPVEPT